MAISLTVQHKICHISGWLNWILKKTSRSVDDIPFSHQICMVDISRKFVIL